MLPIEEIRELAAIPFNSEDREHMNLLKDIWKVAYPDDEVPPIPSNDWKKLGFQVFSLWRRFKM